MRQSHKMQAVGQLAGGLAHDFNNILLGIQGSTELALRHIDDRDAVRDNLEEALTATERASTLVRQLLAFSRQESLRPRILNLNDLIDGLLKMLGRLIGEHVTLSVTPASRSSRNPRRQESDRAGHRQFVPERAGRHE